MIERSNVSGAPILKSHVAGHKLPLVERQQVRRECEREIAVGGVGIQSPELLLDLGRVPVTRDAVCADVLIDRDEVGLLARDTTGAGDARLGVDHEVVDRAGAGQRCQTDDRGRRVAARVRDEVGSSDLVAVELGQAVDGVVDQLRRDVLAVPLGVHVGIAQPEVGAQIDDADVALAQLRDERRRGSVGVGDDRGVDICVAIEIELLECERDPVVGVQVVEPSADV